MIFLLYQTDTIQTVQLVVLLVQKLDLPQVAKNVSIKEILDKFNYLFANPQQLQL